MQKIRSCTVEYAVIGVLGALICALYLSSVDEVDRSLVYIPTGYDSETVAKWASLTSFLLPHGLIFGVTTALVYRLFRMSMERTVALAMLFLLVTFPLSLEATLPSLTRDFIKFPLMAAATVLILELGCNAHSPPRMILLAVGIGLIIGLGVEFRDDLIVLLVPTVIAVIFARRAGKHGFVTKLFCLASVLLVALPLAMSSAGASRNNHSQHIVGGLMAPLTAELRIEPSVYDWGSQYLDEYLDSIIWMQATALNPNFERDARASASYGRQIDAAGFDYALRILRNFPADMLVRGLAATRVICDLPFTYSSAPAGTNSSDILAFYRVRAAILSPLNNWGAGIVILALVVLSLKSLRIATLGLALILFFTSYPAMTFHGRHYFHLVVIPLWALGFLVQVAVNWLTAGTNFTLRNLNWRHAFYLLGIISVVPLSLASLRLYQTHNVRSVIDQVIGGDLAALPVERELLADGIVRITSPTFKNHPIGMEILVASFAAEKCSSRTLWPIARYVFNGLRADFSRSMALSIPASGTGVTVIMPVLWNTSSQFIGFDLPETQADCLTSLARVQRPERISLVLWAILPNNWSQHALYQRLDFEVDNVRRSPPELPVQAVYAALAQKPTPITLEDLDYVSPNLQLSSQGLSASGRQRPTPRIDVFGARAPEAQNVELKRVSRIDLSIMRAESDLLRTKVAWHRKGDLFVASGFLRQGGFRIGLVRGGWSAGWVDVIAPGHFDIALEVPEDGEYWLGLSSVLEFYTSLANDFSIDLAGWVEHTTTPRLRQ